MDSSQAVALYIRVSSTVQVDGFSLEAQEAALRTEVESKGKWVYKIYCDAGISGAKQEREGLLSLLRDASTNCFGEVLVWTISRISRNLKHLLTIVEELKSYGIIFRSLSENFDLTGPMGQFTLTMMGAVAQMQRESWMESSKIGMVKRAKSGRPNGLKLLGYQNVPDPDDPKGGGKLVIIPEEAEIIRQIFQLYVQGKGYRVIANRLNEAGHTGKNGRPFGLISIQTILSNSFYVGMIRFAGEEYIGLHEPIVSNELWNLAQERRKQQSKVETKKIKREYLLSGLLKCPVCGSSMIPTHTSHKNKNGSRRWYYYYSCSAYWNKGRAVCRPNSINADVAETQVLTWLAQYLKQPFWLRPLLERQKQEQAASKRPWQERQEQLRSELLILQAKQNQLLTWYENDELEQSELVSGMKQLKEQREACQAELSQCPEEEKQVPAYSQAQWLEALKNMRKVLRTAAASVKKDLLRKLIVRIQVNEKKQLESLELHPLPGLMPADAPLKVSLLDAVG
ncbi:MAG: hypothetical protein EOM41_08275 [Bacilli bacterium]|nr:hypothetical protein [Bacilli bacterium]